MHLLETVPPHRLLPAWLREGLCGFVYWLLFLLVLEPDNLLRASHAGYPLAFGHEALRITIAALLGASVTPMVLTLTRRFPMLGSGRWRNVLIHCVGTTGLALALILISCLLAAWGFYAEWLPTLAEVRHELVANGPLLIYALFAFTAIAHAVHYFSHAADAPSVVLRAEYLSQVPVKMHGRLSYLELANVDWIETQGNYLGLHVGSSVHLIRETLQTFEDSTPIDSCASTVAPSSRSTESAICDLPPMAMRHCGSWMDRNFA